MCESVTKRVDVRLLTILYWVLLQMPLRSVHVDVKAASTLRAALVVPVDVLTGRSLAVEIEVVDGVPAE